MQVAWAYESCAPLITGGIRLLPAKSNNNNSISFNFSNLKQLLRCVVCAEGRQSVCACAPQLSSHTPPACARSSVSIGGMALQPTSYGSWVHDSPSQPIPLLPPFQLTLVSKMGQRITKVLPSLAAQDLGVNFD